MKLRFPLEEVRGDTVVGSWFPFGVGIDCHKEMVWACVLKPDYATNRQHRWLVKFGTSPSELARLRLWLEELVPPSERRFLVESTSTYHFPILHALTGWVPTVINPKLVGSSKRKTDRWDAQMLAHHSMAGTFPAYVMPTPEETGWRVAYRRLLKIRSNIIRNVNALFTRFCLFGVNPDVSRTSKRGRELLWELCGRFAHTSYSGEGLSPELAPFAPAWNRIPKHVLTLSSEQLREVERLELLYRASWGALLQVVDARGLALLKSVPHINDQTAVCYLAEVGRHPLRRFTSLKGVVAYSGFDPSARVSADHVTSRIPTAGSRFLRRGFLQAAQGAMLGTSILSTYGQAIRARVGKRGWFAGVNAVGRKLVRYCTSVLVYDEPFQEGLIHGKEESRKREWEDLRAPEVFRDATAASDDGRIVEIDGGFSLVVSGDPDEENEVHWQWGEGSLGDV